MALTTNCYRRTTIKTAPSQPEEVTDTTDPNPPPAAGSSAGAEVSTSAPGIGKSDLLVIGIIVLVYAISLLLMSPARNFGYLDDWTYARTVEHVMAGQGFHPSEFAQATLVTHVYWGALFASLFGMTFTSLTLANLALSLVAAITFYLMLRRLGLSLRLSGLGVALLVFNPYYIVLSYSYMTEITFLAFMLLACLCYLEGLRGEAQRPDERWLWLGSIFAALTFLTRQFGLALPLAVLVWLLLARKLDWRSVVAVALLPCAAAVAYFAWSSGFGTTFSGSVGREELLELVRSPGSWIRRAAHFVYLETLLPGIMVPLMVRLRRWRLALLLCAVTAGLVFALWQVKLDTVEQGQGSVAELSYEWLRIALPNPALVYCVGSIFTAWLAVGLVEGSWPRLLPLVKGKRKPGRAELLYILGAVLFIGTFVVSAGFLDRYWMPLWPVLIAAGLFLLRSRGAAWGMMVPGLILFVLASLYGIATHLDDYDNMAARWEAGQGLVAQGVPYDKIENGSIWDGYYLYEEALNRHPSHDVLDVGRVFFPYEIIDKEYVVADAPQVGYQVIKTYNYFSRRTGFATRELFVLKRD
jgi:4-amino-4-deoxy-L-arabinose transferase-like glycosyltransferase